MINRIDTNVNLKEKQFNQRLNRTLEFNKVLENVIGSKELKLSSHAADRLKERNIDLNEADFAKLRSAVEKIRNKGGKEALILYKDVAYVTSIKNNTVITAVDSSSLKENIFTNIDSAVII